MLIENNSFLRNFIKNTLTLVLSSLVLANLTYADETTIHLDKNAIDQEFKGYSFNSMKASFTSKRFLAQQKRILKGSGDFYIDGANGLCWQMKEPFNHSWLFLDNEVVEFDENGEVVEQGDSMYTIGVLVKISRSFSSGDIQALYNMFEVSATRYKQDENVSDKRDVQIFLTPKNEPMNKFIDRIVIKAKNKVFEQIMILDKQGGFNELNFINAHLSNLSLKDLLKSDKNLTEICNANKD
ncbi:MAG: outer membrane lipoprotein carrier protein LolA [Ruminobacter sp.]|nr:outer membrane lipoprotein carrier protein LolA [Ruminobacter sp.]